MFGSESGFSRCSDPNPVLLDVLIRIFRHLENGWDNEFGSGQVEGDVDENKDDDGDDHRVVTYHGPNLGK